MKTIVGLLFALIFLSGCSSARYDVEKYRVDIKYCVSECMQHEFGMFHHQGESWGTGSSSMAGLAQSQIYDRVKEECAQFYSDETCCKRPPGDYSNRVIKTHLHGYNFGACVKSNERPKDMQESKPGWPMKSAG